MGWLNRSLKCAAAEKAYVRAFPPAGAGKPLAAEEEDRSDIADHHHGGEEITRTVCGINQAGGIPIARHAFEANCRRQVTMTTSAVVASNSQGLTNQPR